MRPPHAASLGRERTSGRGLLAFCLSSAPQLPVNSQVGLTHCLPLSPSLFLSCYLVLPFPISPCAHGQPLLLYSLSLFPSAFLCLYYPFSFPPRALNNLCSILYLSYGWYLRGKGCLSMGLQRHPLPALPPPVPYCTSSRHIPGFFFFSIKHNTRSSPGSWLASACGGDPTGI